MRHEKLGVWQLLFVIPTYMQLNQSFTKPYMNHKISDWAWNASLIPYLIAGMVEALSK